MKNTQLQSHHFKTQCKNADSSLASVQTRSATAQTCSRNGTDNQQHKKMRGTQPQKAMYHATDIILSNLAGGFIQICHLRGYALSALPL